MAYRAAIIGAGFISDIHAEVLTGLSDVSLSAVVDPFEQRARELAPELELGLVDDPKPVAVEAPVVAPAFCHPRRRPASARLQPRRPRTSGPSASRSRPNHAFDADPPAPSVATLKG